MKNCTPKYYTAIIIVAGLLLTSCSGDSSTPANANESVTDDASTSSSTSATGCCFTQDADFDPFFPAGNDMIIPASDKLASHFFCGATDDPMKSNALKNYWIDTLQYTKKTGAKDVSLRIEDHSADPSEIVAKIERKKNTALESAKTNTNVTVKELKTDSYAGYSWVDASKGNNASNILIEVVVDGRFYVQIMGVDHTRIELGMQLLEMIPMKDLAAKCK